MLPELIDWIQALDREVAFLFAIPFLVAIAGLVAIRKPASERVQAAVKPARRDERSGRRVPVTS